MAELVQINSYVSAFIFQVGSSLKNISVVNFAIERNIKKNMDR